MRKPRRTNRERSILSENGLARSGQNGVLDRSEGKQIGDFSDAANVVECLSAQSAIAGAGLSGTRQLIGTES